MKKSLNRKIKDELLDLSLADKTNGIRSLFINDKNRVNDFSYSVGESYFDLSKTHISQKHVQLYKFFADDCQLEKKREKLFKGYKVNTSENRPVLHTLLRDPGNQGISTVDPEYLVEAEKASAQFKKQYQQIQNQINDRTAAIKDIIHIGIGGSSLGSKLIYEALKEISFPIKLHFIGNVDAHHLVEVLEQCDASTTLVIGVSKTFSTAETLKNIKSVGNWFTKNGINNYLSNIYAVTASWENAQNYGIPSENIITFPKWVGGRYSVWSSVSLSVSLIIGIQKFEEFLAGASEMDKYFYNTPLEENVCFLTASMDHYYTNFFATCSKGIFAYDYRLRSIVDYLQQLETESNGKDRQIDGSPVDQKTSPVVWGGIGTDVQHSVFQMLHQGTSIIPAEFILVKQASHKLDGHHTDLLANGLAQSAALLSGQDIETVIKNEGINKESIGIDKAKAKIFSGNRPSTTILINNLCPRSLGSLLAFYEHRTFCSGILVNINSYDQMGVELGKRLANEVKPLLKKATSSKVTNSSIDPSTLMLVKKINSRLV